MDPKFLAQLIEGVNKTPAAGTPGPVRYIATTIGQTMYGPHINIDWLTDRKHLSETYEVYLLEKVYGTSKTACYVDFRKVWSGSDQISSLSPTFLRKAAVYYDPNGDTYHLLIVGRNKHGLGKPQYLGVLIK